MEGQGAPGLKRVSSTKTKYYLSDKNMFTQTQVFPVNENFKSMTKAKNPMRQTQMSNNQSNNRLHESKSREVQKDSFLKTDYMPGGLEGISPTNASSTPHKKKISLKSYLKQST